MSWQPKHLTREQQAERRAEAIRLLEKGEQKQVEIAHYLGVTEAAVSKWKRKMDEAGPDALQLRKAPGRPSKLGAADKQALVKRLTAGAIAAGFPTEQWTQARVNQVIQQEFGVKFHPNAIRRLLRGMGWSVQKPETRAIERDEDLIAAWLRKDWPRIKKAQKRGAQIVFEDESGVVYDEPVSFTWAPKGQTPILKRLTCFRRETSTWVGLSLSGKIYKRHFDGSVNAEKVVIALAHLVRRLPGPLTLIWDRAQAHCSKRVQTFLQAHPDIQLYLPPYAPELNPEEYCHGNVKRQIKNSISILRKPRSAARLTEAFPTCVSAPISCWGT